MNMVTKSFQTKIEIDIVPQYHQDAPHIVYGIDHHRIEIDVPQPTTLTLDYNLEPGAHRCFVEFTNKKNEDTVPSLGLDKTVTISAIRFLNFESQEFLWKSEYLPQYPEPWYSEQIEKPPAVRPGVTTLGWNGCWQLDFESPVFPWIHRTLRLGWVWGINPAL